MQEILIDRRTVGVNFLDDSQASIVVWSPGATTVDIVGPRSWRGRYGNVERLPLQKKDHGYWELITDSIAEGTGYKVSINGKDALPDPASLSQPDGVHSASEAINLTKLSTTDVDWKPIPLQDYIIYELHTGTFTDEGTFAAIEGKLDHLKNLGITAVEIMPLAQFTGGRNWGYDGVFPFAVQHSYGGAKGLKRLVDACHAQGLAVIMDVVYNHLGPEGNYLPAFGPYFTDKYKTPWGSAVNFDDSWCDGVRRYFIENVLMWFRDFGVDALRLDAVHAIKDFSPVHILQEMRYYVDKLSEQTGRRYHLIAELDLNDTRYIKPLEAGGYGADAQWTDEFHHALRVTATGEQTGWYKDFNGIEDVAKSYRDAYVYDGQWSPHRKKYFGVKADDYEGAQFIAFSQNHDQVGNRMMGERSSALVSFEMQKLMVAAVMISPFLPMLFMGEEWAEPNPFLYFVSHGDKELCDAVCKGRKEEFAAFHAEGEAPDPTDEQTFLQSKLQWNLVNEGRHRVMLDYYKALIALRKTHPVLQRPDRKNLAVQCNAEEKTLMLHRWRGDDNLYCFLNFSTQVKGIAFEDAASLQIVFDSADEQWNGNGGSSIGTNIIQLQPESILLLSESS